MRSLSVMPKRGLLRLTFLAAALLTALSSAPASLLAQEDEQDPTTQAIVFFNLGQEAHEKGKLDTAIEFYEKALKLVPEFPEAEYQRGHAFVRIGKRFEAEKAFRRAIELREDWSLALAGLGGLLVSKGQFSEAEPLLNKALALDALNFPAFTSLVELKLWSGADAKTLEGLLRTSIELTSKANPPSTVLVAKASLERSLGNPVAAGTSIAKALAIDPNDASALAEGALIAIETNDPTRADDYVTRLERRAPGASNTKILRARVLAASGKLDEARALLESLEDLSPAANVLMARLRVAVAADPAELEKQLANEPSNATLLGKLCGLNRRSDPVKAMEYCRRASAADPNEIGHAIGFGAAMVQAKRYDDAVIFFRKLSAVDPTNSTIRANLATALFQLKRYQEAKVEYRWIVDNQPNLNAGYYFLAISHDRLEEYADAMANYQEFLRRADPVQEKEEIERTKLRLPSLQKQLVSGKGSKKN